MNSSKNWRIGIALGGLLVVGCTAILGVTDIPAGDAVGGPEGGADTGAKDDGPVRARDSGADSGTDSGSEAGAGCAIGGTPYASGATNPSNACQSCQPSVSTSGWSDASDGTACGTGGICHTGACVSGCQVGGVYYATSAANPNNPCQSCQPATSTSAWTSVANGTSCGGGQVCASGACGTQCAIGGTIYPSGAINPSNACQSCQPGTSTTGWTALVNGTSCGAGVVCNGASCVSGCYVSGSFYGSGVVNPSNACQSCQPGTSTTAWTNVNGVSCATGTCSSGTCINSCTPGGSGMTNCGAGSESCCASLPVTGGTYSRTYTNSGGGATGLANPATVSPFRLDKYEVTVGRFRQFVSAWNNGAGYTPPAGSGKHTHVNGGGGLNATGGGLEPGWATSDNVNISLTNANLACNASYATWTSAAGNNEKLPMNCANWWESYAFCIWDGGFLPSEAEWEFAAAGGSQQREYPWGTTAPGTANQYAIYGCYYPSGSGSCTNVSNIAPVGTATQGAGLWGHLDLAGNPWEWTLDYFSNAYIASCTNCANLTNSSNRVIRGGGFASTSSDLLPPSRFNDPPVGRFYDIGFRCARTP